MIERLRLGHVISGVKLCLNPEKIAGISNVPPDIGRHRADWLEDPAENLRIRLHHRISGIGNVGIDVTVVGVDDHLDAVAHVARTIWRSRRVRISVARRVRV